MFIAGRVKSNVRELEGIPGAFDRYFIAPRRTNLKNTGAGCNSKYRKGRRIRRGYDAANSEAGRINLQTERR